MGDDWHTRAANQRGELPRYTPNQSSKFDQSLKFSRRFSNPEPRLLVDSFFLCRRKTFRFVSLKIYFPCLFSFFSVPLHVSLSHWLHPLNSSYAVSCSFSFTSSLTFFFLSFSKVKRFIFLRSDRAVTTSHEWPYAFAQLHDHVFITTWDVIVPSYHQQFGFHAIKCTPIQYFLNTLRIQKS